MTSALSASACGASRSGIMSADSAENVQHVCGRKGSHLRCRSLFNACNRVLVLLTQRIRKKYPTTMCEFRAQVSDSSGRSDLRIFRNSATEKRPREEARAPRAAPEAGLGDPIGWGASLLLWVKCPA
jgi:hypothetical protein